MLNLLIRCALVVYFSLYSAAVLASSNKDECLEEFNKLAAKTNSTTFYGYGSGYGEQDAVDNARVDLAKQVRTKVTSQGSVSENNKDVSLDSITTSSVSESLIGLKVLKRCPMGAKASAVVSLNRSSLLGNLRSGLQANEAEVQGFLNALAQATNGIARLRVIKEARVKMARLRQKFHDDLSLCKAFRSCHEIVGSSHAKLDDEINKNKTLLMFAYKPLDDSAKALRQDLTKLMEREGYEFTNQASKSEIQVRCDQKLFPKVKEILERYLEIKCTSEIVTEGEVAFTLSFSGSGAGENQEQAFEFARNQLQLDDRIHD